MSSRYTTRTDWSIRILKLMILLSFVVGIVVLMSLLAVSMTAGTASAQGVGDALDGDAGPTNESESESQTQEIHSQLGDLIIRSVTRLGDGTGEIVVVWTGETPQSVSHAQINVEQERLSVEGVRLIPGEETTLTVDLVGDNPSMLWTEQSLSQNRFELIRWERGSSRTTTLTLGLIYGASTFAAGTIAIAWRRKNRYDSPSEGWD